MQLTGTRLSEIYCNGILQQRLVAAGLRYRNSAPHPSWPSAVRCVSTDSVMGLITGPPLWTRKESALSAGSKLSVAGSGSGEGGGGSGVSSSSGASADGAVAGARSGTTLPPTGPRRAGADLAWRALATGIVIVVGVEEPGRSAPAEVGSVAGGTGQRSGEACCDQRPVEQFKNLKCWDLKKFSSSSEHSTAF